MKLKTPISKIKENQLIQTIIDTQKSYLTNDTYYNIFKGIGDDAGVIDLGENYLVITTDLLNKKHFPKQMSYKQIGWKIITVNISDLAAMGAKPQGIVLAMALPSKLKENEYQELITGVLEACQYYNCPLIGGDTNTSNELTLTATALGIVKKKNLLPLSSAKPNDKIALTGPVGLTALGLEYLLSKEYPETPKGFSKEIFKPFVKNALEPKAQIFIVEKYAKHPMIRGATDITDGLARELQIISQKSNVGIMIYEDKILHPKELELIAKYYNKNPEEYLLHYGEDFELILIIDGEIDESDPILDDLEIIGEVTTGSELQIMKNNGNIEKLSPHGYEHS